MGGGGGGGGSRIGTVCRGRAGVVLCVRQRSRVRLDPSSPVRRCTNRRWSNCGPNLSTQVGTRERASCLQTMARSTLVAAFALSAFARRLPVSCSGTCAGSAPWPCATAATPGWCLAWWSFCMLSALFEFHDHAVHDEHHGQHLNHLSCRRRTRAPRKRRRQRREPPAAVGATAARRWRASAHAHRPHPFFLNEC